MLGSINIKTQKKLWNSLEVSRKLILDCYVCTKSKGQHSISALVKILFFFFYLIVRLVLLIKSLCVLQVQLLVQTIFTSIAKLNVKSGSVKMLAVLSSPPFSGYTLYTTELPKIGEYMYKRILFCYCRQSVTDTQKAKCKYVYQENIIDCIILDIRCQI